MIESWRGCTAHWSGRWQTHSDWLNSPSVWHFQSQSSFLCVFVAVVMWYTQTNCGVCPGAVAALSRKEEGVCVTSHCCVISVSYILLICVENMNSALIITLKLKNDKDGEKNIPIFALQHWATDNGWLEEPIVGADFRRNFKEPCFRAVRRLF